MGDVYLRGGPGIERSPAWRGGVKPNLPYLETMPPFAYFSEQEVVALADYLKQLGGVAGKGAAVQKVNQSGSASGRC